MNSPKNPLDRLIDSTYDFGRFMRKQMMGHSSSGSGSSGKNENLLHVHALFLISEEEGLTMKKFADSLRVSSPSATSLVNRLVKMQWVGRLHDEENRKLVRIRLTPLGKRILKEKHDRRREVLRHVFGHLSRSEQLQLARLHEKLSRAISTRIHH